MSSGHTIPEATLAAAKCAVQLALSTINNTARSADVDYQLAKAIALEAEATEIRQRVAAFTSSDGPSA